MNKKKQNKRSSFLPLVAGIIILLIAAGIVAAIMLQSQKPEESQPQAELESWNNRYNESNLIVRGIISDVKLDYKLEGDGIYHVFPALVELNITEVVWVDPALLDEMGVRHIENDTWDRKTAITVAYDKSYPPTLSIGQNVEACGYYYRRTTSTYVLKLVIEASINGSYMKLL